MFGSTGLRLYYFVERITISVEVSSSTLTRVFKMSGGVRSLFVITLFSISSINVISGYLDPSEENQTPTEGAGWYASVKGIRDKQTNYIFRLNKVTQITPSTGYPSDIGKLKISHVRFCSTLFSEYIYEKCMGRCF